MTRSKDRIIQSSFELFEQKPFEKITVEEILEKAYVSRGTFYKHFSSKYDLMYLYYSDFLGKNILSEFDGTNWKQLQIECFKFGKEHKSFFTNVKHVQGFEGFWEFMNTVSFQIFKDIKCHNEGRDYLKKEEELTIECYVEAAIHMFKRYVFDDLQLSATQVSEILYNLLPDDYKIHKDQKL